MKRTRKHQGAQGPLASIHVTSGFNAREHLLGGQPLDLNGFVTGSVTTKQFKPVSRAVQRLGQEANQSLVRGGIDGRGGDFDAQLVAERFADFIPGSAGLELDGDQNGFGLRVQIGREHRFIFMKLAKGR